jgi:hypothetical protein
MSGACHQAQLLVEMGSHGLWALGWPWAIISFFQVARITGVSLWHLALIFYSWSSIVDTWVFCCICLIKKDNCSWLKNPNYSKGSSKKSRSLSLPHTSSSTASLLGGDHCSQLLTWPFRKTLPTLAHTFFSKTKKWEKIPNVPAMHLVFLKVSCGCVWLRDGESSENVSSGEVVIVQYVECTYTN